MYLDKIKSAENTRENIMKREKRDLIKIHNSFQTKIRRSFQRQCWCFDKEIF